MGIHTFEGGFLNPPDGANPRAGLIRDKAANLYGTTNFGGGTSCPGGGCGTIFKVSKGKEVVLYSFSGPDGANPQAGVIRDSKGNLYGTTFSGGSGTGCGGTGCGVVFRLDSTGNETVLYSFTGKADGGGPMAGLVRDSTGHLYGTTIGGGTSNAGTVFRLNKTGKETVLYSFTGGADGVSPGAGLIRDSDGNLYGTTAFGGGTACFGGCGTVFKLDTAGKKTVLHIFTGGADGALPEADLVQDSAGNLYGTTYNGGGTGCGGAGCGVVFEVSLTSSESGRR